MLIRALLISLMVLLLSGCFNNKVIVKIVKEGSGHSQLETIQESSTPSEGVDFDDDGLEELPKKPVFTKEEIRNRKYVERQLVNYIGELREYIRAYKKRVEDCQNNKVKM